MQKIPVVLVTGFLGAGKTSAIRHWLNEKPKQERWAILVNEFGSVDIDAAVLRLEGHALVQEIAGGCICCSSGPLLRIALNRLIREKPALILIEPTGLASPARLLDLMREPAYQPYLEVRKVITVVDIERFVRGDWRDEETYVDQINLADILVGNKTDTVEPDTHDRFLSDGRSLYPPKELVHTTQYGRLPLSWLQDRTTVQTSGDEPRRFAFRSAGTHFSESKSSNEFFNTKEMNGVLHLSTNRQGSLQGFGIILSAELSFSLNALIAFFNEWQTWLEQQRANAVRGKGLFRCGNSWWLFNWADGSLHREIIAWRKDSRIELIADGEIDLAWEGLTSRLLECRL